MLVSPLAPIARFLIILCLAVLKSCQKHFRASPELFSSLLGSKSLFEQQPSPPNPGLSLHRMHMTWARRDGSRTSHLCHEPQLRTKGIRAWASLVDDEVASHLLSLYFAWENPTWQLVEQHLFLRDLASGSRKFCSPLLVHTLLFFGCVMSLAPSSYPSADFDAELLLPSGPDNRPTRGKIAWQKVVR